MTHYLKLFVAIALVMGFSTTHRCLGADDLLIADFEAPDYGEWTVTGEAFGPGPAQGTLEGQMEVSGFLGDRLVNTFYQGDKSTGTLTSPAFEIERPFINFLIGGGQHPGETCINLLVNGEVVRTATGPNAQPGGSERLGWHFWDVSDLIGQEARIQIVDSIGGGWGHINIDQIVQSEKPRKTEPARRSIAIAKRYLHFPVRTGGTMTRMKITRDGKPVREFDIELATDDADFVVFTDVGQWMGEELVLEIGPHSDGEAVLAAITPSDDIPDAEGIYKEPLRPQFHFTSRRGWHNDPNGLVYYKGEWHLYYQHNPYGWNWGNMHWGHAVSTDLFHWRELGDAIFPWSDVEGAAFSGSAVMDWENTSGFQTGDETVMIAALTDTGAGEAIGYSNDRGRTFTMYEGNPVWKHQGRDPKIIWHEPTERWIMTVYDEQPGKDSEIDRGIQFVSSKDLKNWLLESRISGFYECPDFFELRVMEMRGTRKWVLYAADGKYVIGGFDGKVFTPEHEGKHQVWWGNFYAAQSYSDAPDDRRVQIGWANGIAFRGMPFNQQMTVPVELSLHATENGIRMYAWPVKEIEGLHLRQKEIQDLVLNNKKVDLEFSAELIDATFTFETGDCNAFGLTIAGEEIVYDKTAGELTVSGLKVPVALEGNAMTMRVLVDRGSIEVFVDDGRVAISRGVMLGQERKEVEAFARGGQAKLANAKLHELKSSMRP
jgi:fructan beta-fructosidase